MKNTTKTAASERASKNQSGAAAPAGDSGIGEIKVHENVISSLARLAALGVEGVSRLAGNALVDNIAEIVGIRSMQDRAITVRMAENDRVAIEIRLNLKLGYRLPKVASEVQKAVIAAVENATGMTVTKVDVLIQAVEADRPADGEADADDNDKTE